MQNQKLKNEASNQLKKISEYFKEILPESYIINQAEKNINTIVYKDMPLGLNGNYNYVKKEISVNINANEDAQKISLIHEMLHAITYRDFESRGFKRKNEDGMITKGIGLDEIITEEIAEEITGAKNEKVYRFIRPIYVLYKKAIGKEYFIKDYVLGTDTVKERIEEKFSKDARNSI